MCVLKKKDSCSFFDLMATEEGGGNRPREEMEPYVTVHLHVC